MTQPKLTTAHAIELVAAMQSLQEVESAANGHGRYWLASEERYLKADEQAVLADAGRAALRGES